MPGAQPADSLAEGGGEQRAMAVGGSVLDAQQAHAALGNPTGERIDGLAGGAGEMRAVARSPSRCIA